MNEFNSNYNRTLEQVIVKQNSLIRQVYAWMGAGLTITAFMALVTLSSPLLLEAVRVGRTVVAAV